jgi:hypothetical protein
VSDSSRRWNRWILLFAAFFGSLAFALFLYAAPDYVARPWTTLLFDAIAFLGFEPPEEAIHVNADDWRLDLARGLVALFALFGIAGLFLEFYGPARDGARRIIFRLERMFRGRDPAIVVGLGSVGSPLARELRFARRPVYAIATYPSERGTEEARSAGVLVMEGEESVDLLREDTDIAHATEVFITTGDDVRNIEVAGDLLQAVSEGRIARSPRVGALEVYVHASDPGFAASFASHRLLHDPTGRLTFHGFNLQQQAARDLMLDPRRGIARREGRGVPYYVVFGFGSMGQTVALQMARLAHFSTFFRPRLSIVDAFGAESAATVRSGSNTAEHSLASFLERYPAFCPDPLEFDMVSHRRLDDPDKDGWGCRRWRPSAAEWRSDDPRAVEYAANAEFMDLGSTMESPRLLDALLARIEPLDAQGRRISSEPSLDPVLVLCFDDERRNFEAALALRQALESARFDGRLTRTLPLYVYLRNERGLATLLEQAPEFLHSDAVELHLFGLRESGDLYRQIARLEVRKMARVVQESYNQAYGGGEPFNELSPAFQASNIDAAAHADVKLDAIGCRRRPKRDGEVLMPLSLSPDQIVTLAHMEHNRWMAERLTSGWRIGERRQKKAGAVRLDNQRRPSFVPWATLAEEQRHEMGKDVSQVLALDTMLWRVEQVVERISRPEPSPGPAARLVGTAATGSVGPRESTEPEREPASGEATPDIP